MESGLCYLWLFLSQFFIKKKSLSVFLVTELLEQEPESGSVVIAGVNLCQSLTVQHIESLVEATLFSLLSSAYMCLYVIFSAVFSLSHCLGLHIRPI